MPRPAMRRARSCASGSLVLAATMLGKRQAHAGRREPSVLEQRCLRRIAFGQRRLEIRRRGEQRAVDRTLVAHAPSAR